MTIKDDASKVTEYRNCAVWKSQDFACGREKRCLFDTYDQFMQSFCLDLAEILGKFFAMEILEIFVERGIIKTVYFD